MAKRFALKFKKLLLSQTDGIGETLTGEILSINPIKVSVYGGEIVLSETDGDVRLHKNRKMTVDVDGKTKIVKVADLNIGDVVILSGRNTPYTIIGVI